jgi:hypothetical protein
MSGEHSMTEILGAGVAMLDYDNDGDLDLLLAGNDNGLDILRIYRNNNAVTNAPPGAPANLGVNVAGAVAEFSWSAPSDDHTSSSGLDYNLRIGTSPGGAQVVSPQSGPGGYRRLVALGNAQGPMARIGSLQPGTTYYWSVQAIDAAFAGSPFATEGNFVFNVTGVPWSGDLVTQMTLSALPNPFRGPTTIVYTLASEQSVRLGIHDLSGRLVLMLMRGTQNAGRHVVSWNGRDERGQPLSAGVYFARLEGEHGSVHRALVLMH